MSEGEIELLRIGPGDHFGEIGLLTGHPRGGDAEGPRAGAPPTSWRRRIWRRCSRRGREVSQELCRALARRQAAGQLLASPGIDESVPPSRVAAWFSDRLHRLFDLAQAE